MTGMIAQRLILLNFKSCNVRFFSYHCENPYIVRTSVLQVFPFPTKRNGRYYIGGAGHELFPEICPVACRPPDHQDWEYC